MRVDLRRFTATAAILVAAACTSSRIAPRPAVDRNLLVQEQFADHGFNTAYDVIESMRSNWLAARGPDSFTTPSQVQVYLDGTRVGGVDMLRTIDLRPVTYMRFFDGVAATARWGLDHGAGAIYVSTHPLPDSTGANLLQVFAIPETIGRP
jgi:hypothetical protein